MCSVSSSFIMDWINFLTWRCRCPFRSDPAPILAASCKNAIKCTSMETQTYLPGEVLEGVNWDQIEGNSSRTEEEGHCAHLVASSLATPGSQLLPPPPSPTTNRQTLSLSSGYVIAWNRIFVFRWFENPGARFQKCKIHDDQISLFLHYLYFVKSDQIK